MSLKEWLLFNFANQKEINNAAWSTIFGVVVSMLCQNRNNMVFSSQSAIWGLV